MQPAVQAHEAGTCEERGGASFSALIAICLCIQLPTAFPPPCLALAQKSVQKSSENHAKSVRIEARGTSRGRCGALLGFPLAQRAKNIQNVSSWTALRGPSETPNLRKLGRRRPNASQNCVQNLMSESCSKKLLKSVQK